VLAGLVYDDGGSNLPGVDGRVSKGRRCRQQDHQRADKEQELLHDDATSCTFVKLVGEVSIYVIDYIIAHEVSHLAHQDHSYAFWECVENLCPNYEEGQNWLKEHGKELYIFE